MSTAKPTGGPAFPVVIEPNEQARALLGAKPQVCTGLTIRDSFAIAALQGELAASSTSPVRPLAEKLAQYAYEVADAMLAERAK